MSSRFRRAFSTEGTLAVFALLTIGLILRRLVLAGQPAPGLELSDDVSLEDELTRLVLGYLGVEMT